MKKELDIGNKTKKRFYIHQVVIILYLQKLIKLKKMIHLKMMGMKKEMKTKKKMKS